MKPEERVQRDLDGTAAQLGYQVFSFDQGYRPSACPVCGISLGRGAGGTRQTPGISDRLYVRALEPRVMAWVEVKAGRNTPTQMQEAFMVLIRSAGGHAFPAWSVADLLWGLACGGDRRFTLPKLAETSPGFRVRIEKLYPAELEELVGGGGQNRP